MTARLLEPAGDVETLIRTAAFRGAESMAE